MHSDLRFNPSSGLCINLDYIIPSITAPQDAHRLVLQVAEWLTNSLSGLARHELSFSTGFKKQMKVLPHIYYCLQGKGAHKQ